MNRFTASESKYLLSGLLFCLMLLTALLAHDLQPSQLQLRSEPGKSFILEQEIPKEFGTWKQVASVSNVIANPEIQEILDRIYSQILTRTYVNAQGYRIMLSVAYGEDQRGELQAHRPEVCYPAQGFELTSNEQISLKTSHGSINARRLMTHQGQRFEPITYWFNVGDKPLTGRLERRVEEVRLVLTGAAPDGMLFRVSSIDPDTQRGFDQQLNFISELLSAVSVSTRRKISGL
jgi:EpsI family protein